MLTFSLQIRHDGLAASNQVPARLQQHNALLSEFDKKSHRMVHLLLRRLTSVLKDSYAERVHAAHSHMSSSDTGLKIESVPCVEKLSDVPPSEHTDKGSITLLFCEQYTTEVFRPKTHDWIFIAPRPDCAIVNVADSLQALTDGQLKSSLHRVGQISPGVKERLCVLYYLRPCIREYWVLD